jgi:hypothetical protein
MSSSIFKVTDLLQYGIAFCGFGVSAVVIGISGVSTQGTWMLLIMALLIVLAYGRELWGRQAYLDSFDFEYAGIHVDLNGYSTNLSEVAQVIEDLCRKYKAFIPDAKDLIQRAPIWVHFKPGVIKTRGCLAAGVTQLDIVEVGYFCKIDGEYLTDPYVPLQNTAFTHEIEHIIIQRSSHFDLNEADQHVYMDMVNEAAKREITVR